MRILLCEDEAAVAAAIARGLQRHGAAVDVVGDGADALHHARVYRYDESCWTAACRTSAATTSAGR